MWNRIKRWFRAPLTPLEQRIYDKLDKMGYEAASAWMKNRCQDPLLYPLIIMNRGVQLWIKEHASQVVYDAANRTGAWAP